MQSTVSRKRARLYVYVVKKSDADYCLTCSSSFHARKLHVLIRERNLLGNAALLIR